MMISKNEAWTGGIGWKSVYWRRVYDTQSRSIPGILLRDAYSTSLGTPHTGWFLETETFHLFDAQHRQRQRHHQSLDEGTFERRHDAHAKVVLMLG